MPKFTVDKEGKRLDAFLAGKIKDVSRSQIQKNIKAGLVTVNDKALGSSYKLKVDDVTLDSQLTSVPAYGSFNASFHIPVRLSAGNHTMTIELWQNGTLMHRLQTPFSVPFLATQGPIEVNVCIAVFICLVAILLLRWK